MISLCEKQLKDDHGRAVCFESCKHGSGEGYWITGTPSYREGREFNSLCQHQESRDASKPPCYSRRSHGPACNELPICLRRLGISRCASNGGPLRSGPLQYREERERVVRVSHHDGAIFRPEMQGRRSPEELPLHPWHDRDRLAGKAWLNRYLQDFGPAQFAEP